MTQKRPDDPHPSHRRPRPVTDKQWGRLSPKLSADKTVAWVGQDRLILDDVTPHGLHRQHVIHYGGLPDIDAWLSAVPKGTKPDHWAYLHQNGVGHLWIVWKENQLPLFTLPANERKTQ